MILTQANELLRIISISHSSPKFKALSDLHVRLRTHWGEKQGIFDA